MDENGYVYHLVWADGSHRVAEPGESIAEAVLKVTTVRPLSAREIAELFSALGSELLSSPPMTPRYNGSIERLAQDHVALGQGRAGQWTAEDLRIGARATNSPAKDAEVDPEPRGEVFRRRDRAPGAAF